MKAGGMYEKNKRQRVNQRVINRSFTDMDDRTEYF